MSGHSFKQLVFEQFFPDTVPPPGPEPTTTTPPDFTSPDNNTRQTRQEVDAQEPTTSWADEVEEELGPLQSAPTTVPLQVSENNIEDTEEKDDVQVTEIALPPDEEPPTATDVTPPEPDVPELPPQASEMDEYEDETGLEDNINDGNTSHTASPEPVKKLTPIAEVTESEGSHDDHTQASTQDEAVGPGGKDRATAQRTEQQEEPPQTSPPDPADPELPPDSRPMQPWSENYPPIYVASGDRTKRGRLPGK